MLIMRRVFSATKSTLTVEVNLLLTEECRRPDGIAVVSGRPGRDKELRGGNRRAAVRQ